MRDYFREWAVVILAVVAIYVGVLLTIISASLTRAQ